MSKVYVVTEYGGQYEDKYDRVQGVCATKGLAELMAKRINELRTVKDTPTISDEQWYDAEEWLYEEFENTLSISEQIDKLHEKFGYSKEDLITKMNFIENMYSDYVGVYIDEYELLTSEQQINGIEY